MPFGVTLHEFDTLDAALKDSQKKPTIGITQGGSSSKNRGARVAARDADVQKKPSNST